MRRSPRLGGPALGLLLALSSSPDAFAQAGPRVVVTPPEVELAVGESVRLRAEVYDASGTLVDAEVRWFAAGDAVAVSGDGTVVANRPGAARVAAVHEGRPTWVEVRVPQLPAEELEVRIAGRLLAGTSAPLDVAAYTRLGERLDDVELTYQSAAPSVASVDASGRVVGHAPGRALITISAGEAATILRVDVEQNTTNGFELRTEGDTEGLVTGEVLHLSLVGLGRDGRDVTGVRPVWSLSPSGAMVESVGEEGLFVAERPGTYQVTAMAGPGIVHSVALRVGPREHTSRLELVGSGVTSTHRAGDTWVFEGADGRDYAYLGTFYHDWAKIWDVTDPASPVLTDSIQLDARRINDVKIHPNNRIGVLTREGASSRRNGIVILDLADPAHPEILSEYTDGVTGGVHNVWILGDEDLIYACHNGTSEIVIIDIADPTSPREVGRWAHERPNRSLHDVIVQDGYAYASFWNDGVFVLDAGAGTHGGTAREPALVSNWISPQGNTHVAWRHGEYLFLGSEIFPADWDPDALGPIEARGYIEVLDMTDIENPVEVARYEVPEAGAHNLWSDDRDRLYVGYYQAGLRVLDISGELRGDLYRQGREIGAVKTSSPDAAVPNWSMTWGAQLHKGRIFTSDLHSGLWIARLVERELVP